ncbi:MAG: electron transfer flavoprotein subunit alpha/FixB family protein [Xanthomonadales bacterium]|nr:electron transfer flavoprotein subunit alpha/FixB family protein [Gammaproteobacteria bacterium]MBT8053375.1 electron transfer flavoprotein subunit alpha/FixB family protein [Gammaproteobacteria bacterium]NND55636.1 electron transfer flavoprotein subunit alpha/FixB family protein [Xanthomonadales bacterium]NNK50495.1 electron transfer flavoprotein subunit alpha/FixB family protein [Xanthomonadales bacterium]
MSNILIIAEHDGEALNISTAKCVSCAQAIGGDIHIAVLGDGIDSIAAEAAALDSVGKVIAVNAGHLAAPLAANWAPEVISLAADYSLILGPSTTFGRDLMPHIAALAGVNQISDIMEVNGPASFKRPIYAGNAIIDVEAAEGVKIVATARTASWKAAGASGSAEVEQRPAGSSAAGHTRYVGLETAGGERPDLQSATKVVSGGRALGSEENFAMIYSLADKLGAGVGASRAAVDAGYCPNDMQVGQTGKIISPDLYLAFGISGAIQHVTGIKDAGTIVAVNKDTEAPIFEISDIGLAGDLFSVIPELESLLG